MHSHEYTSCWKCNERATHVLHWRAGMVQYSCPMHIEAHQNQPQLVLPISEKEF